MNLDKAAVQRHFEDAAVEAAGGNPCPTCGVGHGPGPCPTAELVASSKAQRGLLEDPEIVAMLDEDLRHQARFLAAAGCGGPALPAPPALPRSERATVPSGPVPAADRTLPLFPDLEPQVSAPERRTIEDLLAGEAKWLVAQGDNRDLLPFLPDCCIDASVTDPPAGIFFMSRNWDAFRRADNPADVGRKSVFGRTSRTSPHSYGESDRDCFVEVMTGIFREALRVLKPGGHAVVWSLPRTSSWTARALEDAGFEIRDCIVHHLFGSGFPKSLAVDKAIDKAGGASPAYQGDALKARRKAVGLSREQLAEVVGCSPNSIANWEDGRARKAGGPIERITPAPQYRSKIDAHVGYPPDERVVVGDADVRAGDGTSIGLGHTGKEYGEASSPAAQAWAGWGTALKPAAEHWLLARRPLNGTVAANVLAHGTGALNIDRCRIEHASAADLAESLAKNPGRSDGFTGDVYGGNRPQQRVNKAGRWPTNAIFSHAPACRRSGASLAGNYTDNDGTEAVPAWECLAACACGLTLRAPSGGAPPTCECGGAMWWACPVAELDRQSGARGGGHDDTGGASRFFPTFDTAPFLYAAKPSTAEKADGLDAKNSHKTVKGQALMRYLCRLVTPPGGLVLDPFAGSGSTGVAALAEGFRFLGIEREPVHVGEARARCALAERDLEQERSGQRLLFGGGP